MKTDDFYSPEWCVERLSLINLHPDRGFFVVVFDFAYNVPNL
jgi:hypothetical protein